MNDPRIAILEQRMQLLRADMEAAIGQMGNMLGQVVSINQKYQESIEKQLELLRDAINQLESENGPDVPESSTK